VFQSILTDVIQGDRGGVFAARHFNTLDTVLKKGMGMVRHSCDPSCGLIVVDGSRSLIAIRPINAMQEITIDLSTWRDGAVDEPCHCNRPLCRKTITDFDKLPKHLRDRYLRMKIVNPDVMRRWAAPE
jgi:hypothetical protein